MIDSTDPHTEGLHEISAYAGSVDPILLSGEELQDLIKELKAFLSYQLYKKQKEKGGRI